MKLPSDRHDVPIDKYDPSWGPRRADVIVVEFADFECGYCRTLSHTMARLRDRYQDRVRFVFKHYPMDNDCNREMDREMDFRNAKLDTPQNYQKEQARCSQW